ncbi:MAG: glycine--tRNA ligase subunit beta, partial [Parvibaculales bacterium]
LAPYFIIIADIKTADEGAAIRDGNERVLRARLSDGRFYWEKDCKVPLESRLPKLDQVIFHAKLGLLGDKTKRMTNLAGLCAAAFKADKAVVQQAAALAKVDLLSGMVYEFPELQGIMGGYYASAKIGKLDRVGKAIYDHYKPLGPNDNIPATPAGCVVALADKIDTLAGFWLIDEKPTGSKDPYALRRAALGVIRIILENETPLPLLPLLREAMKRYDKKTSEDIAEDLLGFIVDRLKIYLRDTQSGITHDIVQAIFSHTTTQRDDILTLKQRATQLQDFINSEAGGNMLAAYNRATGILEDSDLQDTPLDEKLYETPEEKALADALDKLPEKIEPSLAAYTDYLNQLATLRQPVDVFFEAVMVNDDDDSIRNNRLALLKKLRDAMNNVGQLAAIEKR